MTIIAVLDSYLRHRLEVDAYLQRRAQQARAVRQQNKHGGAQSALCRRSVGRTSAGDIVR